MINHDEKPDISAKENARKVKSKLTSASIWSLISAGSTQISTFIIFIILARLLGPPDFGIVAFAAIFIDLSRGVMLGGIPEALIQRPEWKDDLAQTAFWINVFASLAFVLLISIVCAAIIKFELGFITPLVVTALSATLVIDALRAVHEARLRREFRYRALATRAVVATILGGVVGVGCALAGMGVWALVINRSTSSIFQTVVMWRAVPFRLRFYVDVAQARALAEFGAHVLSSRLLGQLNARLPDFIIGALAGSNALGIYRVGSRSLNFLVQTMITPIQTTALSAFSRLDGPSAIARAYVRFTQLCGTLTFPAFIGSALIADDFIEIFFGSRWHMSAPIMSILALGVLSTTILQFFQAAMQAVGRPKSGLSTEGARLIAGIFFISGLAFLGPVGAAVGDTLRKYATLPESLRMLRRELQLMPRDLLRGLLPPFLCAVGMASVLFLLKLLVLNDLSPFTRLLLLVIVGAVTYPLLMLTFGRAFLREMLGSIDQAFPAKIGGLMWALIGGRRAAR